MFGNLFGGLEEKQNEIRQRLATMQLEGTAGDGAVTVIVNGNREMVDVRIDRSKLDWEDTEQVQDLILAASNDALRKAEKLGVEEGKKMLEDMLPPGFGGLASKFFG